MKSLFFHLHILPRFWKRGVVQVLMLFVVVILTALTNDSAIASNEKLIVVVVDGVGDTPQAAMRNAAENGLKMVLGSYVDTERTLKKTSEETNGAVTRKKEFVEKYREYSRGFLKDVERISVDLENGIYKAIARVTVKVIE